jgi:hypothetical protein
MHTLLLLLQMPSMHPHSTFPALSIFFPPSPLPLAPAPTVPTYASKPPVPTRARSPPAPPPGRLSNMEYFTRLLDIIRSPLGRPLLEQVAASSGRLVEILAMEVPGGDDPGERT